MKQLLSIPIEPLEEGGFLATSFELPAPIAQGRAIAERVEMTEDVAGKWINCFQPHGQPRPRALQHTPRAIGVARQISIPTVVVSLGNN